MPHHEYDGSYRKSPPRGWFEGSGSAVDLNPKHEERDAILFDGQGRAVMFERCPKAGFNVTERKRFR